MELLVLGVSNVVRNRLLPAIAGLPSVAKIHLASHQGNPEWPEIVPERQRGETFGDYQDALAGLEPCLAYISLPNHLHALWVERALSAGFHSIVDKPAFLSLRDTERLLAHADARQLCLAEATVWSAHPQVDVAKKEFLQRGTSPCSVQATFAFPGPPADNFRNDPARGGGCLNDLGPYAASSARVFFREEPTDISCLCLSRHASTGVDSSFAVTASYPGAGVFQGFFSFCAEYRNTATLLGAGVSVTLEPVFTTQLNATQCVLIRSRNEIERRAVELGNSFGTFVAGVIGSIERRDWAEWTDAIRMDARFLDWAARKGEIERNAD